jgi:hypothetical protein
MALGRQRHLQGQAVQLAADGAHPLLGGMLAIHMQVHQVQLVLPIRALGRYSQLPWTVLASQ